MSRGRYGRAVHDPPVPGPSIISSANGLLRERIFLKGHLEHPPDNLNGDRTGCGAAAGHGASATELWSSPTLDSSSM
jgi:hypothetical protein